jgi:carbonyl reductase 1
MALDCSSCTGAPTQPTAAIHRLDKPIRDIGKHLLATPSGKDGAAAPMPEKRAIGPRDAASHRETSRQHRALEYAQPLMRLAIVTGANRGLGLETGRRLAEGGYEVVFGARRRQDAEEVVRELSTGGLAARSAALDVTSPADVDALAAALKGEQRTVDVLVNNAGIALKGFDATVARRTLDTNYTGAARVTDAMLPLLAPGARVVMVSSGLGEVSCLAAPLRRRFLAEDLGRAPLDALVEEFVRDVQSGTHSAKGWPSSAYSVSKVALNALVRVLVRELGPGSSVRINAVCPGWVRTDMGGRGAPRSLAEGARSILWATAIEPAGPTGGFFRDGQRIGW